MFYLLKYYNSSWYGFGTGLSLKLVPRRIKSLAWLKNLSHLHATTLFWQLNFITYTSVGCPCWSKADGMGHYLPSTAVSSKGIGVFLLVHSALYCFTLKYMYTLYTHRSYCIKYHGMNSPHPILDIKEFFSPYTV